MKNTSLLVLFLFVVCAGLVWILMDVAPEPPPPETTSDRPADLDRQVERVDEGRVLRVVDSTGATVRRYSIDDFNEWTAAHWDEVFDERPSFGEMRDVDFDAFRQFDRGVALSPRDDVLVFSVSDYAAATTISFVGVLDIASGAVTLVDAANRGDLGLFHWSPGGRYVAYRLHTARAQGDGLSVDRVAPPKKQLSLTGTDLLAALDGTAPSPPSSFRPAFDDLTWMDRGRLSMTSRVPQGNRVRWRVDVKKAELTRVD